MPEERGTESRSGCAVSTLLPVSRSFTEYSIVIFGTWGAGNKKRLRTDDVTKVGIPSKFVMSNWMVDTFSAPCFWSRESRRSSLRPVATKWEPLAITFSASARPMPDVAPITRTFLYAKGIAQAWTTFGAYRMEKEKKMRCRCCKLKVQWIE